MSKRAHLYYIDGLRVLGTIAVFVYHLNDQLITLNENYGVPLSPAAILPTKAFGIGLGQAAVALFFVISGFVLMYTTSDSRLDVSRYAKRRILDIFPFFYSAYIVAFFYCRASRHTADPRSSLCLEAHLYHLWARRVSELLSFAFLAQLVFGRRVVPRMSYFALLLFSFYS